MFIHVKPARVLIDSGAIEIYISPEFAKKIQQKIMLKKELYQLCLVDGTPTTHNNGWVFHKTKKLGLGVEGYLEYLKFDITKLASEDTILRLPWLQSTNPQIDWSRISIRFKEQGQSTLLDLVH